MDEQRQLLSANEFNGRIVVSIQGDIAGANLQMLQTSLLDRLQKGDVEVVVFDVSAVDIMDLSEFDAFANVVKMTELLGVTPVIIGINPGVAAFLAESAVDTAGLRTALGIDDVDRAIRPVKRAEKHGAST